MDTPTLAQFACVAVFTAVATATDLRNRKIPNWLTVSAAIIGVTFHIGTQGLPGLWFSLAGFGVGFGILFVLWIIGGGGGGDVKLMGAVGAWLGPQYTFGVFILSVFFSILCMGAVMMYGGLRNVNKNTKPTNVLKKTIPYALPCGLSTWSIFLVQMLTQR